MLEKEQYISGIYIRTGNRISSSWRYCLNSHSRTALTYLDLCYHQYKNLITATIMFFEKRWIYETSTFRSGFYYIVGKDKHDVILLAGQWFNWRFMGLLDFKCLLIHFYIIKITINKCVTSCMPPAVFVWLMVDLYYLFDYNLPDICFSGCRSFIFYLTDHLHSLWYLFNYFIFIYYLVWLSVVPVFSLVWLNSLCTTYPVTNFSKATGLTI